jgi:hypothetical protein
MSSERRDDLRMIDRPEHRVMKSSLSIRPRQVGARGVDNRRQRLDQWRCVLGHHASCSPASERVLGDQSRTLCNSAHVGSPSTPAVAWPRTRRRLVRGWLAVAPPGPKRLELYGLLGGTRREKTRASLRRLPGEVNASRLRRQPIGNVDIIENDELIFVS